ncbi:CoA-binding protein [Cohnella rhizosphaerae]|uniref:CoA-binding protein n=1 Tax=Cohnella rhizosphaerae TaxID=1457232 RepID=A0A9X4QV13_9BACL|nr:CoA-binding protein [Cohnella rhizosphaerae]MDG0812290.1 CoA-binding protein [Cohnella rhizosphaerae]
MPFENPGRDEIKRILLETKNIAVVGLSGDPDKTSHMVSAAMQAKGYRIIPVNPKETEILGEKCYKSLADIPDPIDIVNVFRRPEHTPEVAAEAVAVGAKVLWLQLGIANEEAAAIAANGGLTVIMDRCIKVEDSILLPQGRS